MVAFHTAGLPRTGKKWTEIKNAPEGRAKRLFLFIKYARFVALSLLSLRRIKTLCYYWCPPELSSNFVLIAVTWRRNSDEMCFDSLLFKLSNSLNYYPWRIIPTRGGQAQLSCRCHGETSKELFQNVEFTRINYKRLFKWAAVLIYVGLWQPYIQKNILYHEGPRQGR